MLKKALSHNVGSKSVNRSVNMLNVVSNNSRKISTEYEHNSSYVHYVAKHIEKVLIPVDSKNWKTLLCGNISPH